MTMVLGADSTVPFGGFLMLPTMTRPWTGLLAILVNVIVTGCLYAVLAKNRVAVVDVNEEEEEEPDIEDIQIF